MQKLKAISLASFLSLLFLFVSCSIDSSLAENDDYIDEEIYLEEFYKNPDYYVEEEFYVNDDEQVEDNDYIMYEDIIETEEIFVPIFKMESIPPEIIQFITGVSYRENDTVSLDMLSYLTISHFDFNGEKQIGNMIVALEVAEEVLEIFEEIFNAEFPIASIRLIDYFEANDNLSLAANNSSAFNFRYIAGTTRLSRHAFGMAIDINPIQNPYIRHGNILPEAGNEYLDRENIRPGMIIPGDVVYNAFVSRGWTWGGHWTDPIDYHHFEKR